VDLIHRGKYRSLSRTQRRWLKRRQAIEPAIGHLKHDHRMDRCWLQGTLGDALHAVLCAAGYHLRWLIRAVLRGRIKPLFWPLWLFAWIRCALLATTADRSRAAGARLDLSLPLPDWEGQTLPNVA
jgi:transposase, IS5 family